MSVSRDTSKGTWTVYARYIDWQGKVKVLHKRGFKTKREAVDYEREFLLKKAKDVNMGFAQFIECYLEDLKPRLKYNTYLTKENIIRTKILPYFEDKALADICTSDIMQWQNEILQMRDDDGRGYSPTYLKTISAQMSAIFNHATRYYDLKDNPCQKIGNMGRKKAKEMLFWTRDEFFRFIETMKSKPMSYYVFELLFWTGIREGELLALTREDVDLEKKILHIRKSYQRLERKDYITEPKTEKSNRDINLPDFLCEELEDYFGMLYKCNNDTRLFEVSKHYLQHEMKRGCKESGVKRIRIHDLRHSHVAYLIELGFSPVEIAERMGHESISVTFTYSHLYPSKQKSLADKLNEDREKALEKKMENSEIYKRNNLIEGVVPKKNDEHARKRNVIINNRVTPEDRDIIYKRIELSGLKVQDYITECCKYSKVTAVGNVKTFDAIRREMKVIDEHLSKVQRADELDLQVLESLRAILEILRGFYEEE